MGHHVDGHDRDDGRFASTVPSRVAQSSCSPTRVYNRAPMPSGQRSVGTVVWLRSAEGELVEEVDDARWVVGEGPSRYESPPPTLVKPSGSSVGFQHPLVERLGTVVGSGLHSGIMQGAPDPLAPPCWVHVEPVEHHPQRHTRFPVYGDTSHDSCGFGDQNRRRRVGDQLLPTWPQRGGCWPGCGWREDACEGRSAPPRNARLRARQHR